MVFRRTSRRAVLDTLPPRAEAGHGSVEWALAERRSVREYAPGGLSRAELGQLLLAAQGITSADGLRTTPSAGALYPLEVYVAVGEVCELPAGIYRYRPDKHALAKVAEGDPRPALAAAAGGQACVEAAAVVIGLAAVHTRTTGKYGKRGIRYVHMEAGHVAQNVYLQAAVPGLGTVVVGAFDDRDVGRVLHLAPGEEPIWLMPAGRLR